MGGSRTPAYKTREPDNVMDALRCAFGNNHAFEYTRALQILVRDFSCQRRTAAKMLNEVIDAGRVLTLTFMDNGMLWKADNASTAETIEFDSFPRFIREHHFASGMNHTNNHRGGEVPAEGNSGLAFPDIFAGWHAQYKIRMVEQQERRAQERREDLAQTLNDNPEFKGLAELSAQWEDHADMVGKISPLRVHVHQAHRGAPFVMIDVRGKRAKAAAADLLAVLEKHFPMRNTTGDEPVKETQ